MAVDEPIVAPRRWRIGGRALVSGLAITLALPALIIAVGAAHVRFLDLAATAMPLLFALSLAGLLAAGLARNVAAFGVCVLAACIAGWGTLAGWRPGPAVRPADGRLLVATFNAKQDDRDVEDYLGWARASGVDIAILQNSHWRARSNAFANATPLPWQNGRVVVFSTYPISNFELTSLEGEAPENDRSMVSACVYRPGGAVRVVAGHPISPRTEARWRSRNRELAALAALAATSKGRGTILAGDFNAPRWSPFFLRLAHRSGLVDAERRFWPRPTWPANSERGPYIAIDHILTGPDMRSLGCRVGPSRHSDHYPLVCAVSAPTTDAPGC